MNRQTGYMLVSLAAHAALGSIGLALSGRHGVEPPPVIVDFSIQQSPVLEPQPPRPKSTVKAARPVSIPAPPKVVSEAFPDTAAKETIDSTLALADSVFLDSSALAAQQPMTKADATDSLEKLKNSYIAFNYGPIRDRVFHELSFPPEAVDKGWDGSVKVSFTVQCDGRVDSIHVMTSSGHSVLDQSAIDAVKHAAPYPKSPKKVEIQMPISYKFK